MTTTTSTKVGGVDCQRAGVASPFGSLGATTEAQYGSLWSCPMKEPAEPAAQGTEPGMGAVGVGSALGD
eukprot:16218580-Heterocapsa_arctica.AAC.1